MFLEFSDHHHEIVALCEKFQVMRLEAFGSAVRGDFDPTSSDVDLIAHFSSTHESGYADRYLDFAEALEALFKRKVDLLTPGSIRNPRFSDIIRKEAVTLYESEKHQAA